jgi:hypothetical protein
MSAGIYEGVEKWRHFLAIVSHFGPGIAGRKPKSEGLRPSHCEARTLISSKNTKIKDLTPSPKELLEACIAVGDVELLQDRSVRESDADTM